MLSDPGQDRLRHGLISTATRELPYSGFSVNQTESGARSFSRSELLMLPRWRTGGHAGGHKLVGHAEQVPQHIGICAREANQNRAIVDVVVRDVVNIGSRSEQLGSIFEIHANDKRSGFGRAISGYTCQEFSVDLERVEPVRSAFLHTGQRKSGVVFSNPMCVRSS